jgi:hypothetical protein
MTQKAAEGGAETISEERVLSIVQAVERSTFSDRTIRAAIASGELMAYRRRRRIIIWERDLIRWLRSFDAAGGAA